MVVGHRNKKSERKIFKEQPLCQKISLQYIYPHLKHYQKDYKRWIKRYYVNLAILLPEIVIILVMSYLLDKRAFVVFCFALNIVKAIWGLYVCVTAYPNGLSFSIYARKGK